MASDDELGEDIPYEIYEVSMVEDDEKKDLFQCSACNIIFSNVEEHVKEFHENTKDEDTPDLEENSTKELSETEGLAFVIKNASGKYECKVCLQPYKSLRRYLDHVKKHSSLDEDEDIKNLEEKLKEIIESEDVYDTINKNGQISYCCKICKTIFSGRKNVLLHYPIHQNVARAHKAQKEQDIDPSTMFHCKLCNRSLVNGSELKMHMNAHAENQAKCSNQSSKSERKQQQKRTTGNKNSYTCQYCQKEFKRPHEKVKHERIHTGEKPYSCDLCGKAFRVTYCLSLHKKNVHSEERPYVCSFESCNKRFKSQSVYNHHLNTHGTAKNFKCPFCPKAFKTSVQLSGHKNTHTKPFPCDVCSRTFSSLYAVKSHMEVHRNIESTLKYTCKICSAQYGRSFALSDHMKSAHSDLMILEENEVENDEHYEIEEAIEENEEEVYSVVITEDEENFDND